MGYDPACVHRAVRQPHATKSVHTHNSMTNQMHSCITFYWGNMPSSPVASSPIPPNSFLTGSARCTSHFPFARSPTQHVPPCKTFCVPIPCCLALASSSCVHKHKITFLILQLPRPSAFITFTPSSVCPLKPPTIRHLLIHKTLPFLATTQSNCIADTHTPSNQGSRLLVDDIPLSSRISPVNVACLALESLVAPFSYR